MGPCLGLSVVMGLFWTRQWYFFFSSEITRFSCVSTTSLTGDSSPKGGYGVVGVREPLALLGLCSIDMDADLGVVLPMPNKYLM